jgi:uncharacterized protein YfaS (alpha-2-macroglobulin family)
MTKKFLFAGIIAILLLSVTSCVTEKTPTQEKTSPHSMISAYTTGTISRTSPIRIRFITDIVDSSRINQDLDLSPFSFSPRLKGRAFWPDTRTLEFRPEKTLDPDQKYNVTLKLSSLMETPKGEEIFTFQFKILQQSFEITIDGLQAVDQHDIKNQQLSGHIILADTEDTNQVSKMLNAVQSAYDLTIRWHHDESGRKHRFIIKGITREEDPSQLTLTWNGKYIGVDQKGKRIIDVPGLNTFDVTQARVVRTGEQYIELRFSDPLKSDQNLRGLVRVDNHRNLSFTIHNNIIQVFSQKGWSGESAVHIEPGIINSIGHRLKNKKTLKVHFEDIKPQVRFAGKGVIIPTTHGLTIPIEAINLKAVIVEAVWIYDQNMQQFLQVNNLNSDKEVHRVGRTVWKNIVQLDSTQARQNQWIRYGLDVTPLVENNPGGLYRIKLTFQRPHIIYSCTEEFDNEEIDLSMDNWDDNESGESSNWDYYNEDFNWSEYYHNRNNPCHPAYYRKWYNHDITVTQNFLISNFGLIAKQGNNDSVFVAVTDIRTSEPLNNISLKVFDFQQNVIGFGKTDSRGTANIQVERKPFLLTAQNGNQWGYLKLNDGSALSLSHFDVGGTTVQRGIKGYLYGERGVWRPGDTMHLTFILMDDGKLPENHPVRFELYNPRGQLIKTINQKSSLNGFYPFQVNTSPDDPTGNWLGKVKIGGAVFEKTLKVETVMPNRLKIHLDFGKDVKYLSAGKTTGEISATWLHGAIAKQLQTDVEMDYVPVRTRFSQYSNFEFDDQVRKFEPESRLIFEGKLDDSGKTSFLTTLRSDILSKGMLKAHFTSRVFEPGGAFSTDRFSISFHPYDNYIGIHVPEGDKARGMLLTDTTHTIRIVRLDKNGRLEGNKSVEVKLYKIKWRWWWEKESEDLAGYVGKTSYRSIQEDTVKLNNGKSQWHLKVKYPSWGRYLIRVRDLEGKHITSKIVYIDWPGWAGRAQKDQPGGANILTFASDKNEYKSGEKIMLTIPTGKEGRGLVSIESGTRIIKTDWIQGSEEPVRYSLKTTPAMAPNIYIHVTFIQPHMQVKNDLPIRMYGVIPIKIFDPETQLEPQIETAEVFEPEATSLITVKENHGKPMTYTLAVVDEGLLDLTHFTTPNAWNHFYRREALGVKTWDLYEWVAGAYGGSLEKLLAIGGGMRDGEPQVKRRANRFPPMVRFYGPFELGKNKKKVHEVDIPQYIGSVRVMVVAGQNKAFGSSEKAVFVRKPLMVLGTLPRVLSIEEEVHLPVSVFALDKKVKDVTIHIKVNGPVAIIGPREKKLRFTEIGDQMINFRLKAEDRPGIAEIFIQASSRNEKAGQHIELDVRNPVRRVVEVVDHIVETGKTWRSDIHFPGMAGTNAVTLEVSRIPPLNLGKRLNFLIRYPHGCVEQTTSSVFPQLYLNHLLNLSTEKKLQIEDNIKAGIEKLRNFQRTDGGFGYWQGDNTSHDWCSSYAGHFLIEARNAGYNVPSYILDSWINYQSKQAQNWTTGPDRSMLIQAYRLYGLALAGRPELGAMNRLKETDKLHAAARWQLASAYQLSGQYEAARELTKGNIDIPPYRELSNTYGSDLRDKALILEALSLMNDLKRSKPLVKEISKALSGDKWLSTQTTAFALIALARHTGLSGRQTTMDFLYSWNEENEIKISTEYPVIQRDLQIGDDTTGVIVLKNNTKGIIYPRLIMEGQPRMGRERASQNGIKMEVDYFNLEDEPVDATMLSQGTDVIAEIKVANTGQTGKYEEIALTHLVPSGWEIHNERINTQITGHSSEFEYQDIRDDRIYTYFDLEQSKFKTFRIQLNASYLGRFYLPPVHVETMYDATIQALIPGRWIEVVLPDSE